jgi:CheY-like chemotaxis protein
LGLAIAKELAVRMGGEIGVTSQAGSGSEFWFTVRLDKQTPGASPADVQPRWRGKRVLVADDNPINQEVALGILRHVGLCADAVADGAEAVSALTASPYDLVLMDMQMPETDGLEATRIIRDPDSAVLNHQIPIIAMTANTMSGQRERCFDAGMNGYVTKPVSPAALFEALSTWLPQDNEPLTESPSQALAGIIEQDGAEPDVPVFDRTGLLARLMKDEELAKVVIAQFLKSVPQQIESLRRSLEAADVAALRLVAHSVKGASANVGGERLRQATWELEQAAQAGDLPAAERHLAAVQVQFERLQAAMRSGR